MFIEIGLNISMTDKAICWTCNKFVYSGELDVGYCFYHDRNVKESSYCKHHPDYVDGEDDGEDDG